MVLPKYRVSVGASTSDIIPVHQVFARHISLIVVLPEHEAVRRCGDIPEWTTRLKHVRSNGPTTIKACKHSGAFVQTLVLASAPELLRASEPNLITASHLSGLDLCRRFKIVYCFLVEFTLHVPHAQPRYYIQVNRVVPIAARNVNDMKVKRRKVR